MTNLCRPTILLIACLVVMVSSNQLEFSERIAGGETATANEYPWMAYLILRNGETARLGNCAGTLINRQWILTDSSCVKPEINS